MRNNSGLLLGASNGFPIAIVEQQLPFALLNPAAEEMAGRTVFSECLAEINEGKRVPCGLPFEKLGGLGQCFGSRQLRRGHAERFEDRVIAEVAKPVFRIS